MEGALRKDRRRIQAHSSPRWTDSSHASFSFRVDPTNLHEEAAPGQICPRLIQGDYRCTLHSGMTGSVVVK